MSTEKDCGPADARTIDQNPSPFGRSADHDTMPSEAHRLLQIVATSHVSAYHGNARFKATIDQALHSSTADDVMAQLVRGLDASCADTEAMTYRLRRLLDEGDQTWPVSNREGDGW